jgi:hypothetical protein
MRKGLIGDIFISPFYEFGKEFLLLGGHEPFLLN